MVRFLNGVSPGTSVGERHREHVRERAVGPVQRDRDLAGRVVGLDARDVGLGLAVLHVVLGTLDAEEERRSARLEVQHALNRVLEVGGLDRRAVRVLQPLAERQLIGRAVLRDLRHVLRENRDQLGSRLPVGALVADQSRVDGGERLPTVHRVRQRWIQIIRLRSLRDRDRSAFLRPAAAAAAASAAVVVATTGARSRASRARRRAAPAHVYRAFPLTPSSCRFGARDNAPPRGKIPAGKSNFSTARAPKCALNARSGGARRSAEQLLAHDRERLADQARDVHLGEARPAARSASGAAPPRSACAGSRARAAAAGRAPARARRGARSARTPRPRRRSSRAGRAPRRRRGRSRARRSSRPSPTSIASSTSSGVVFSSSAISAMLGERPSLPVSRSIAPDIDAFSSWSARGTRIAQPLSRKWRLISPTTFGVA